MKKGCEIMKTRNIRLLSLLLTLIMTISLFSCSVENDSTPDADSSSAKTSGADLPSPDPERNESPVPQPHDTSVSESEDSPVETEQRTPEYADFVMPKETDELTVYTTTMLGVTLSPAVEIFEKTYPGIHVTVKTLGEDEYEALIRTEIPAGQGPDLLFSYGTDLPDICSRMEPTCRIYIRPSRQDFSRILTHIF